MAQQHKISLTVGIGASAGGLAVLKQLVRTIANQTQMVFVVVQHLDPDHRSQLAEILGLVSPLPVLTASHNVKLEPGHIYVAPANAYLELNNGQLKLVPPLLERGCRKSIDHFFCSLASSQGNQCAGVVLSGTGSDGTAGLREIKAAGGLTLVQDPDSAEHSGMPLSAIKANVIDEVIPAEKMFAVLQHFSQSALPLLGTHGADDAEGDTYLDRISATLLEKEGFNLKQYKLATVQRRVARRMSLCDIANLEIYSQRLQGEEGERKTLIQDLLINVTDFFRDPEAFDTIERSVLTGILSSLDKEEELRVWVAGCASGEEAYSLAIIISEALEASGRKNPLKIFATDIDEQAIDTARKGIYPNSITNGVPRYYLDKYFVATDSGEHYRIRNNLRKTVSFAVQNVISDPPFSRMHLISCRNLLIYLTRKVQERVLGSFYFALDKEGFLLIGSSESLGSKSKLFATVSKKWRVYQKAVECEEKSVLLEHLSSEKKQGLRSAAFSSSVVRQKHRERSSRSDQMRRAMLDAFLPPAVVVDYEGRILYNHGDWKAYLTIKTGEPQNDIVQLVMPPLRSRIRSGLFKVRRTNAPVSFTCAVAMDKNAAEKQVVQVKLSPIEEQEFSQQGAIGIVFHQVENDRRESNIILTSDDEAHAKHSIEQELVETKEELQNALEELETSSEELKASHEEALSTNEELQSANEELEASSEELRSLNEELSVVNAQLKEKIEQLHRANDDVENFFTSTNLPTVFLDPDLRIQRYTPAAEQLLKVGHNDVGRVISSLGRDLVDEGLAADCHKVLNNFQPVRREIHTYDGKWYIREVTPYRTSTRRVDGVVIVFQEVTAIKELSKRAERRERQQAAVAKLGMMALSGADSEDLMHQAVRQVAHTLDADFSKILKYRPQTNDLLLVSGIGWQEGLVGRASMLAGQNSQAGYTLASQTPVLVEDLSKERRFNGSELLLEHDVVSGLSCKINHSDRPFGVLSVHSKQRRRFSEDDANFILSVANTLSATLRMNADQERLFEREEQFRTMANAIPQLAWTADAQGCIYWFNQRWYDYTGTQLNDVEGWGWQQYNHPDHLDRVSQRLKTCFEHAEEWEDTFPIRGRDGNYRWFLSRAKPIFNQHGELIRWFGTNTDITDQLRQAEALRKSEYKLRLAMDTNKIGSFEYYLQREETHWDPLLRELWGLDENESPSQEVFWQGVHPDDAENVASAIDRASTPGSDGHFWAAYRVVNRRTQALNWVEGSGQVFFEDGRPINMIGMIIDIDQRKKLEQSLQAAVKELRLIDKSKNEFLSILGHELRNPLAALSGSVEILELESKNDTVIEVMKHSVDMMSKLLDDLLDLTRVSQNKIQLTLGTVNASKILENALFATHSTCKSKGLSLSTNIREGLYVNGDATRLEQIFCNLIVNACRYTPAGGTIEVYGDKQGEHIVVTIRDSGVGLHDDHLKKIFDPFFQIKQDKQAASGLGIGLALSRELTELHGGEIWAESDGVDKGSMFVVRLRALNCAPRHIAPAPLRPELKSGLKVLLVEDNENILATMPLLLESLGCNVVTAASGAEGLSTAKAFQPDAMLIDIGLPDITGHAVAEALRGDGYQGLLIAVSGYSHKEVQKKSSHAGFDYHLAKPARLPEIAELLTKAG